MTLGGVICVPVAGCCVCLQVYVCVCGGGGGVFVLFVYIDAAIVEMWREQRRRFGLNRLVPQTILKYNGKYYYRGKSQKAAQSL
jgi:hypothetical protein